MSDVLMCRYDNANNNLMYNRYNAISQYINTQSISDNYVGVHFTTSGVAL